MFADSYKFIGGMPTSAGCPKSRCFSRPGNRPGVRQTKPTWKTFYRLISESELEQLDGRGEARGGSEPAVPRN
jgi:hypothetical protein